RIKRVPIIRDGQMVGIVSRENLLRALAAEEGEADTSPEPAGLAGVLPRFVKHFETHHKTKLPATGPASARDTSNEREDQKSNMQNHNEMTSNQGKPTVLTPDQLHKISEETAMAKAKEALAKMNLEEEQKKSLHDAFMSREPPADALERL